MNEDGKVQDKSETNGDNDDKIENDGPVPGNHLGGLAPPIAWSEDMVSNLVQ